MARRKRASLKDKSSESLGLTPKKAKGIDMLFGGPLEKSASTSDTISETGQPAAEETTNSVNEQNNEPGNAAEETPLSPPPAPAIDTNISATLPVNEADEVDELGLPVAMESPPSDLEFATSSATSATDRIETDAFDPSLSPFAVPAAPSPVPSTTAFTEDDLSGLMEEDDLSGLTTEVDDTLFTEPAPPPDLRPQPVVAAPSVDTSAERTHIDLGGPTQSDQPSFESDISTFPPADLPPSPPPVTASTAGVPHAPPPPPVDTSPPASYRPDISSSEVPRSDTFLSGVGVESLGGIITEPTGFSAEAILPEDVAQQVGPANNVIGVAERSVIEKDEVKALEVTRYIGQERRENLDREIERLYDEVASELSVNKDDAEFALRTLSEAQDIVFEDARQYDEALYRVAVVKTMLARKRNLRRWSYSWGSFVFFYALVWLIAFIVGFLVTDFLRQTIGDSGSSVNAIRAAWFSALAGGVGGIIGIFYSLYWHVAMKQDFDRQYIMYYLVQPIMGFVLGAVVYFIISAGFLLVNFATNPAGGSQDDVLASTTVVAIQVVFGWIAGFRQRVIFEMIDRIVQRVFPKDENEQDSNPVRLAPADEREQIAPPEEA